MTYRRSIPIGGRRAGARFRAIPVRTLVPNLITLLALCAGLTAIRLRSRTSSNGRSARSCSPPCSTASTGGSRRMIKGTSRFGAELDSLADFVNFGVAPGADPLFLGPARAQVAGWIAAMVFAICAALRLARFNVMIEDPNRPAWAGNFFTGVPAPAGAITVLLPIYLQFLGLPQLAVDAPVTFALHARHRLPDGVAAAGVLRQAGRQARAAGDGAAGVRAGRAVLRAADRLSVVGADHRHGLLSREPAARLAVVPGGPAQDRGRGRCRRHGPSRGRWPSCGGDPGRRGDGALAPARRRASARNPSARPRLNERASITAAADARASDRRDASSPAAP